MLVPAKCPACQANGTLVRHQGLQQCSRCETISAIERRTTAKYDAAYVANRYDRYPTTRPMSRLRFDLMDSVLTALEDRPTAVLVDQSKRRLLDVGYGNGDFIRYASSWGWDVYGNDVNPTPYSGVRQVPLPSPVSSNPRDRYHVITFFDTLEHFEDLEQVRRISSCTDWIFVSFPLPPESFLETPTAYKHLRPGEHHLFFKPHSLEHIFSVLGRKATVVFESHVEDAIRGFLPGGAFNIATVALKCSDE